jgi:NADPH:quinone reductase-like Zn-dependent oxidoreductase
LWGEYRSINYLYTPAERLHYGNMLFDLITNGTLKITIHKVYDFSAEGVREAHSDLVEGKSVGKLVVKVADE